MTEEYDVFDYEVHRPRICREMCSTCIFRPGSEVTAGLGAARIRQLIADARRGESYVICHSTFSDQPAICRGFAESYNTNALRIMERLGGLHEIDAPSLKKGAPDRGH